MAASSPATARRRAATSPMPTEPAKFEQYYEFEESISTIPSHRYLAIRRGQAEKFLWVRLVLEAEPVIERMMEIV